MNAINATDELAALLKQSDVHDLDLNDITVPAGTGALASSFQVGIAAQVSIAAAAAGAVNVYAERSGVRQHASVDLNDAERECTGYFETDGVFPGSWEKFSGLYETRDGHVRIHANFDHHRDGALRILGFDNADVERSAVEARLLTWEADAFETAANEAGLAVSAARRFDVWDEHPHAQTSLSPIKITKIADSAPEALPPITPEQRPLTGIRVLELTRILAGPICGRTLAGYGADVMLVNAPHLPNIPHIADTSRGKRSVHLDLRETGARGVFANLLRTSDVLVQGYRPGAIARLGFGPGEAANLRPGVVYTSLSAYGADGPWAIRRGFDSLVQTATGFNWAEGLAYAQAFGKPAVPRPLPVQILDFASGFLMACGTQAALLRRARQGGSWHVEVSLLGTAQWLRRLGQNAYPSLPQVELETHLETFAADRSLRGLPHGARFERTSVCWTRPSVVPGTDQPRW